MKKLLPLPIFIFFLIILFLLSSVLDVKDSQFQAIIQIAQIVGALVALAGLVAIWYQFKREKDLSEAEIIINLNMFHLTDPALNEIYERLEKSKAEGQVTQMFKEKDIIKLANYITFFEPFYTLIKRNILKIETLDPVLSYRFFLAANNHHVQKLLIFKNRDAFRNIYMLHRLWTGYRNKKGLEPWQSKFCLSKTEDYDKYST